MDLAGPWHPCSICSRTHLLPAADIKCVQQVVGTLLYYACTADLTMLVPLNAIFASQLKATKSTPAAIVHLLDYTGTYPDAILWYTRSNMVIHIHSNASYLAVLEAYSLASSHHFLISVPWILPKLPAGNQPTMAACMPNAASFAMSWPLLLKPKLAPSISIAKPLKFSEPLSSKWAIPNHQRPYRPAIPPPMALSTSQSNNNCFCAMDMRFYWVRNCIYQKHFLVNWKYGRENVGDYISPSTTCQPITKRCPPPTYNLPKQLFNL
jgi:hypothetical protein